MSSYYSNYTTCIHCDNLVAIEQAVISLLKKEGGKRLNQLPDYLEETKNKKIWIVGLFPAKEGWTIIKTWSVELLCCQTLDSSYSRLSALAIELGCDAFYLSVYAGTYGNSGILLETNDAGEIYIAGSCNPDIDVRSFYEQPIDQPDLIEKFSLLEVPELFQSAMQINQHPEIIKKEEEFKQLRANKNPDWKLLNLLRDEAMKGYTERIDEALAKILDRSGIWAYPNLAYALYHDLDELIAAEGKFLYFQPPYNYKIPPAYTLTPEQWIEIYGKISFESE